MSSGRHALDVVSMWEIARPAGGSRGARLPGVDMAGFADRGALPPGLRLVPHPAATLVLDFGASPLAVEDRDGRTHRGSLAGGLGTGDVTICCDSTVLEQIEILGGEIVPALRRELASGRPAQVPDAPTHESLKAAAESAATDELVAAVKEDR